MAAYKSLFYLLVAFLFLHVSAKDPNLENSIDHIPGVYIVEFEDGRVCLIRSYMCTINLLTPS